MALQNAQLVTVAVLDARFAAFEAKIDARFAAVDARFVALEAKMDARFTTSEAKMSAALEKTKAEELVRWVCLVMLGNVALTVAANAVVNAFQHLR
jgi:type IV secretory pathway VirB2 component (pilin)